MNNKNLLAKTILIIAVLIVFLFGIIGIPSSFSAAGLKDSLTVIRQPLARTKLGYPG